MIELELGYINFKCPNNNCKHEFKEEINNDCGTTECLKCKQEFEWQVNLEYL